MCGSGTAASDAVLPHIHSAGYWWIHAPAQCNHANPPVLLCRGGGGSLSKTHTVHQRSIPSPLAMGCFFVPLTQSGYFSQNSMAGTNSCRDSCCDIRKRYCPSNCSVICLKKFADHRSREALSRMKLRTSSLAEA